MTRRLSSVLFALSAVAAAQGLAAGERLVKRTDFDVPTTWAQKTVMGHEFLPCFSKEYWTADRTKPDRPPLGIYDECADALNGRSEVGYFSRLREGSPSKTNYAVENPVEKICKGTYTFEQAMGAKRLANLDQTGRGKYPFFFQLPYDRPSFLLDAEYASRQDREGYRAWRAKHPNCLGAHTLGEYDQQAMWYRAFSSSTSNKQVLAQLRADFPFPPKGTPEPILQRDWFRKWVMESFRREREYCFGETDIWTLHSGCPSLAHIMSEAGGAGFFYECTPQGPGSWTVPGAFSRGASRQYGVPFGWYVANFITAYTRDGKAVSGEESRALNPVRGYAAFGRDRGASRSLIRRQMTYGWLTGACLLEPENWYHYHREEYEAGKFRPSVYAEDLQELVDRAKTTDRGVPYTPVAILVPMWERCQRGYWNRDICDPWSMSAFFLTLEPVDAEQNDRPYDLQRRNGDEACFLHSPFGGIYDVVCPDATRNRANIARTLGAYKAAFVAGDFRREELPEGALENYVREGGTLFISADKLAKGIVSSEFAGVAFGSETVPSAAPLKARYSLFKPTGTPVAVPLTKDGDGNVIVWSRDVGRGRIVTVACDRMLPDDYAKCAHGDYKARLLEAMSPGFRFEVIRGLLKRVQRETVPVTVDGDVQWGVNKVENLKGGKVERSWLVWMFNNKGVRKFVGEPEELDPSKTAHVTVRCGDEVKTADVPPGGIGYLTFAVDN